MNIYKSNIHGKVNAIPSKSMMQRAIALAFLSESPFRINNPSFSEDSEAALELIKALNSRIDYNENYMEITPTKFEKSENLIKLSCGESGLCMRMFPPILALFPNTFELNGEGSLLKRELYEIEEVLSQLGANVQTNHNFPPIRISGPIRAGNIKLNADKTSQFLTGLLIALPKLKEKSTIEILDLTSRPYVNMTIDMVKRFGGTIDWINNRTIEINPSKYTGCDIWIEGDWSNAAVFLIAGAIAGEVTVTELNLNSKQGDKAILEVLKQVGAELHSHLESVIASEAKQSEFREHPLTPSFQEGEKTGLSFLRMKESEIINNSMDSSVASLPQNDNLSLVTVKKNNIHYFEYDAKDTQDLVPCLAILAANCEGKSTIKNVDRLNLKESRRLDLIMRNLSLLGIKCDFQNENLEIRGGKIQGGIFETGNDHRMAMAGALASLTSEKEIIIDNPECVKKSYPNFWEDFNSILV